MSVSVTERLLTSLSLPCCVKEPLPGRVHGVEVRVSLEEFSADQVADSRPYDRHGIKHTCKNKRPFVTELYILY